MTILNPVDMSGPPLDANRRFRPVWQRWLNTVQQTLAPASDNGTTTNRPTTNLYVARTYFDTTLGKPIWVKSLNPTVWCDATGSSV